MAMDYKGLGVIDRLPSYSNEKMLQYSEQLHKVMTQKVPVKVGRGKAARIEYELKYKRNGDIIEKMDNSIKYYKHLYDNEMSNTIELRQYQKDIVEKACEIIRVNKFVYLAMEVRTGKTLTSLSICDNLENVSNVLFLT
jgi:type I site-specific restriction endonuclease